MMQQRSEDRRSVAPKVFSWLGHHRRRTLVGRLMTTKPEGFVPDAYHIIKENEPISQWEDVYQKNRADLSGLLLVYLFYGNDGRISWKEHRQMKKFMKSEGEKLSQQMRNTLIGFLEHMLDEDRFIDMFHQKGYTLALLDDSVNAIKSHFGQEGKYYLMIQRLKNRLNS